MLAYQQLLDISLSPDAPTLQARLTSAAAAMGYGLSSATLIRGRLGSGRETVKALFCNTPVAFLEASRSLDAGLKDPFLAAVLAGDGCYTYDQSLYVQSGAGDLWDNQAAFGYRCGMAVAMHEHSHAEAFSFGVDGPDTLPTGVALLELEGVLRLVGQFAHEAAKRLWTPQRSVDLNALDAGELDALRWAAEAVVMSAPDGRLVISSPGRTDALGRAARKLGTSSTTQALLRVIEGGAIPR